LPGKFDSDRVCCRSRLLLRIGEKHFTTRRAEIATVRNEVNEKYQQKTPSGFSSAV
jgi:hypothetical protein